MEVSTVNTFITAFSAILVAWIGFQAKKYVDQSILPQRSIQTKTLLEVLVPLLNTLNNLNRYTWPEQEKIILELFNGKQVLIPPVLAEEMQHVLSADDDERDEIMQNLYKITDAYANWYWKKLGNPYDDSKIDKRYTATTARNEKIKGWVALIVDMVWFLCGLYGGVLERNEYRGATHGLECSADSRRRFWFALCVDQCSKMVERINQVPTKAKPIKTAQ